MYIKVINQNGETALVHETVTIVGKVNLRQGVVIDENCTIHDGVFVGSNTVIRDNVVLFPNVVIGHNVVIEQYTSIGGGTTIQSQCHITAHAKIGKYTYWGPCAMCINEASIRKFREGQNLQGPIVGDYARIGAAARLFPGVVIGDNAEVGMGAIVMDNVPSAQAWFNKEVKAKYQRMVDSADLLRGGLNGK